MEEILTKLYSLQRRGIQPGLERTLAMLEHLGNPHHSLNVLHVAGTNGKGTVACVLASILQEAGETVGLYTSPHIRSFNERIRINGVPITDSDIVELYRKVEPIAESVGATFFEITTVMALYKFHGNTSTNVLECGLGGRFDATNVVTPRIAIITSIDYDHQEWLGSTLEAIAREKAGIIKAGADVIIGEPRAELRPIFEARAAEVGARSIAYLDELGWRYSILDHSLAGMHLELVVGNWKFDNFFVPFHGEHQIRNIGIALAALSCYWADSSPSRAEEIIRCGVANVQRNSGIRARIEVVQRVPLLVLDVAHNPAGCRALVEVLSQPPFPSSGWNVVFGVMRDKDYAAMLDELGKIAACFYIAAPRTERSCDPQTLAAATRTKGYAAKIFPSIAGALCNALDNRMPTVCLGSFFVIEEALEFLDQLKTCS
ncbi:MAG: bifunctional folylpolyglutamate synthase/dihydrofolate synthase [Candidatus Kapaibacterium sp.]|nr:MAG: bifunctional folylpolyglutamate synthase/dihydrofolate synthase [Candidatus Kapabacteria bacterium]